MADKERRKDNVASAILAMIQRPTDSKQSTSAVQGDADACRLNAVTGERGAGRDWRGLRTLVPAGKPTRKSRQHELPDRLLSEWRRQCHTAISQPGCQVASVPATMQRDQSYETVERMVWHEEDAAQHREVVSEADASHAGAWRDQEGLEEWPVCRREPRAPGCWGSEQREREGRA